jgi:hypothetical protein
MKLCFLGGTVQFNFNALSDTNSADTFESEMFHGFGCRGTLGVEHREFRHHSDDGFHEEKDFVSAAVAQADYEFPRRRW